MRRRIAAPLALILVLTTACAPVARSAPTTASASTGSGDTCGPRTAAMDGHDIAPVAIDPTPLLPATIASADGRRVTVTDVRRIIPVNLYGSIAEIVFSLGMGDRVVGRDTSTTFAAAAELPNVTAGGHDLSAEAILRLDPSVVIADASIGPPEVLAQLREAGIALVMLDDEQTLANVPRHIRTIAAALGVVDAGERLVERVDADIAQARARPTSAEPPPRIAFLYVRGSAGVYLISGDGAGPDEMIEGIGAIDAGSALGLQGFRPITTEALIEAAPDVILVMTDGLASIGGVDGLLEQPGIAQTPAGQHRRIIDMDDGLLLNFGARTGEAMQALADAVYASCG